MKYLALGGLILVVTLSIGCSPSLTITAEPVETPGPSPSPAQTPSAHESTETPVPSSTPVQIPGSTAVATEFITPTFQPAQTRAEGEAQLKLVLIRARSALEVNQLRQMHLDIVRVRQVASQATPDSKEALLAGEFIIEAVVTPGQLAKLKGLGFEVTETP